MLRATRMATSGVRRTLTSDGYIHKTVIPTHHFQASLPKLPLAKLEQSLSKYVASATPLVPAVQLDTTKKIVADFQQGLGAELHAILAERNKTIFKNSSFISQPWFDMYLQSRAPLPINVNPQMTFLDDPNPGKNTQAARAASMLHASASLFRTMRDGHLKPDIYHTDPKKSETALFDKLVKMTPPSLAWGVGFAFGAYALDMSQYGRLFQSTRIPGIGADTLQSFPNSRHVIVQRGPDFFPIDLLDANGDVVPRAQIEATVAAILALPPSTSAPLGALTTLNRDAWATARAALLSRSVNQPSLALVDSALFAVCLEDAAPANRIDQSRCMLHGAGRNRWFDKSFQLIITKNGKCAVNFEHAWGDGVAVLRYFNEVFKESVAQPVLPPTALPALPSPPAPLAWDLTDVQPTIAAATAAFDAAARAVELRILESRCLDSRFLKFNKMAVDGTLQMSFQLAHFRMYGHSASTYESASTAGFKHGRTETIRSATVESDTFCRVFGDKLASVADKKKALDRAVSRHGALTKDALTGKGWDRHLFALHKLAQERGVSHPIFEDPTFATLNEIILSTSTLASPALDDGGFGPVGPRCYGIGYGIKEEGARFAISSFHRNTAEFAGHLQQALFDMRHVIEGKNSGALAAGREDLGKIS